MSRSDTVILRKIGLPGCTDGTFVFEQNQGTFVQAADGNFYGAASGGGGPDFDGTVFQLTPAGAVKTLYTFCSQSLCTDGAIPSGLIQATDGKFYGTTSIGGANNGGTVFRVTSTGMFTKLYDFSAGSIPFASLVQAADGYLYGTTELGGNGSGTVFRISLNGSLTTVYNFCSQPNCPEGGEPAAPLVQATDGNVYGTTKNGAAHGDGSIFRLTSKGVVTPLYSFNLGGSLGGQDADGVIQATNGNFYGATAGGGDSNPACELPSCGTLFTLSVGIGPFVELLPTSGKVGATIQILGRDLTDATSVSFNGTAAAFTLESDTRISATVPAGATTGTVEVMTPPGTLKSNTKFVVRP